MRLFVGTALEDEQVVNLLKMRDALKPHMTNGRFVATENFHFTWLFLGEIPQNEIDGINNKLEYIAGNCDCFCTSLTGVENFSGKTTVAMLRNTKQFTQVQSQISDAIGHLATVPPSRFRPHVTLIRDAVYSLPFSEAKKSVMVFNRPFEIKNISLIQSSVIKGALAYTPLTSFSLRIASKNGQ